MRHSFEPSQPLAELIRNFAGPENVRSRFLHSTKEVYVDSVIYTRGGYRDEDKFAIEAIREAKRIPFVIGRAGMHLDRVQQSSDEQKFRRERKYRLAFIPTDMVRFQELAESLDIYPARQERPNIKQHYLYIDLPLRSALRHEDRLMAEEGFRSVVRSQLASRVLSVTVDNLVSQQVAMPHRTKPPVQEDSDKTA